MAVKWNLVIGDDNEQLRNVDLTDEALYELLKGKLNKKRRENLLMKLLLEKKCSFVSTFDDGHECRYDIERIDPAIAYNKLCAHYRIVCKDYPMNEARYGDISEFEDNSKLKFPWYCVV